MIEYWSNLKYLGKDLLIQRFMDFLSLAVYCKKGEMKLGVIDEFFIKLIREKNLGTKIDNQRVHYLRPGAHHKDGHNHQTATGVYYLRVPKNCGTLRFPKLDFEIEPKEDMFVVVPAEEIHAITENRSDEIRIALAFNIS